MKKIHLLILMGFIFVTNSLAQVTVTNPTNTTPNLAATYATLANAITALNGITSISGPVIITLNAVNPQTAPAGGYIIQFSATATAVNNITIEGSGNTITASAALTSGILTDGIFKIIGADHITLQNFTMQENPANLNTTGISNNMTEWGVALLHASVANGAQNNTIQNNTISLNRTYRNTFGVYSNVNHSATNVVGSELITSVTGGNFANKVYSNAISNVGYGIVFVGATLSAYMDNGNDIGGSSAATANTITNWGATNAALSNFVFTTTSSYCIYLNHQINENVSFNTITSALISNTTLPMGGIFKTFTSGTPPGTITSTITNNTITISSLNAASTMHAISNATAAPASGTFSLTISNNTIVNCDISGASSTSSFTGIINTSAIGAVTVTNNVIRGTTSTAATGSFTGIFNSGAVVNTVNISNNQAGNAGGGAVAFSVATTGTITGISNTGSAATATVNLNNNAVDGIGLVSSGQIIGINNSGGTAATINMNNNQFGSVTGTFVSFSGVQTNTLFGLVNNAGNAASTLTIQGNDIKGILQPVAGTGQYQLIASSMAVLSQNVLSNTFTSLTLNTINSVYFIVRQGSMASGASSIVSNNSIVGSFSKTASGSIVRGYYSAGGSVSGSAVTISGNNFSNVTVTGNTIFLGIEESEGFGGLNSPTKTISANTISNITMGSGFFYGLSVQIGENINISLNSITNVTSSGRTYGISIGSVSGLLEISYNTISSLSSTGQELWGIVQVGGAGIGPPVNNIHHNSITGLSGGLGNNSTYGIFIQDFEILNIYDNDINSFTTTAGQIQGISCSYYYNIGTTLNVCRNNIHNLEGGGVKGMGLAQSAITVNVYNNFISELKAPNSIFQDAVIGLYVATNNIMTNNLYNNSIYLNASSTGTNFGTAGIYHRANTDPTVNVLKMINNIVVNTSTANGTGVTAAFWREGAALNNYAASSNYNLFYAGTPGVKNLIYYDYTNSDQTLAAYQARVSPREANSISLMPVFTSATDLHVTPANCVLDNKGTPVAGITSDIDADTRSVTVPDIGADEFDAYNPAVLAGVVSTAVCSNKAVVNTGTIYSDASCNLIARVLPSGGTPVTGIINTCVTRDATQLYFNAEPYVQRHYDIEPAVAAATATATVTLYFDDSEFILYNTTNPVWPALPTLAGGGNGDPNIANLKVTQFHGTPTGGLPTSTPGNYTGTRVLLTPISVILTGSVWAVTVNVAGFSGFYVHTNMWNAPLPVAVNFFTGIKQGIRHLLNWKVTCHSTPRVTITLERSSDSRNFTNAISSITADAARCQQPFSYTDTDPLKGINYYRLKMTDADGKVTYSSIVHLINAVKGMDILNIAPNPIMNGNFNLKVSAAEKTQMELLITDMQGRVLQKINASLIAGFNSIPVNVRSLAAGTYQLYGNTADGRTRVLRFVVQ